MVRVFSDSIIRIDPQYNSYVPKDIFPVPIFEFRRANVLDFRVLCISSNLSFNAGINIINLRKTWEKLLLAARAIAAVEHPAEVFVISSKPYGQRAVLKFATHTGATPIAGRFTPGAFTNQIQVIDFFI